MTYYFGGTPVVFMTLHDAQMLLYDGARVATTIVTKGLPRGLAPDLAVMSNARVLEDLRRPVDVGPRRPSASSTCCCGRSRPGSSERPLYVRHRAGMSDFARYSSATGRLEPGS